MERIPIKIAYLAADDLHLRVDLGACRFEARPGNLEGWVAGTCHDPTGRRAPIIDTGEQLATITEAESSLKRIPAAVGPLPRYASLKHISAAVGPLPRYELVFGKARPFTLTIETGTSEFDLDLGGVPLKALTVKQGAGRFNLDFSAPNPEPMSLLDFSSGAAGIELENLANANFSQMHLTGGAAGYELDFGGRLSRDAEVTIETSLSGVEIAVPSTTAAKIVAETTVGSVDEVGGFTNREGAFLTEAGMAGTQPLLTVHAGVRMGALQITAHADATRGDHNH